VYRLTNSKLKIVKNNIASEETMAIVLEIENASRKARKTSTNQYNPLNQIQQAKITRLKARLKLGLSAK